jgi:hypothetical protein
MFSKFTHEGIDFRFRADVDAPRRFVENKNIALGEQPFGRHDLLLVSAAQLASQTRDGHVCAHTRQRTRRHLVLPSAVNEAEASRGGWQCRILGERHSERETLVFSIFCKECDSRLHCVGRRGNHHLLPSYADGAGVESIGSDDASRDFRATRANHPGHADDLRRDILERMRFAPIVRNPVLMDSALFAPVQLEESGPIETPLHSRP